MCGRTRGAHECSIGPAKPLIAQRKRSRHAREGNAEIGGERWVCCGGGAHARSGGQRQGGVNPGMNHTPGPTLDDAVQTRAPPFRVLSAGVVVAVRGSADGGVAVHKAGGVYRDGGLVVSRGGVSVRSTIQHCTGVEACSVLYICRVASRRAATTTPTRVGLPVAVSHESWRRLEHETGPRRTAQSAVPGSAPRRRPGAGPEKEMPGRAK